MNDRFKRNWWIVGPIALMGLGVFTMLIHSVGDGVESPWSYTASGWNPSMLTRVGAVVLLGFFFVILPVWALAMGRYHPGWTIVMVLPWFLVSLPPLFWSDAGWWLVLPALGILTLAGAVVNLAQRSLEEAPVPSSAPAGSANGQSSGSELATGS